jgi:uncharacterized protein involved in exopolysaccharide biosynthesis
MNNNETIREKILAQAMQELKERASSVINDIMGDLYTEYLPHVADDTENNIQYRVEGCIKNILQGKITETDSGGMFWVDDGYGNDHLVNLMACNLDLKPLTDIMGETIQTQRIKQLEDEVESLKSQLKDSYRRY